VNVTVVGAAIAGGVLTALLAAGCGAQSASPHEGHGPDGSVQACTSYAVRAIDQHVTVTRKPPACQGLSKAQVNQAVGRAIYLAAGLGQHKAAWRHRAFLAGARLAYLISPSQGTPSPQPPGYAIPGSSVPARRGSGGVLGFGALGFAALAAWILAAGSGSYILGAWIAHGGIRRLRAGGGGLPPLVIFGHFGLAAAGLLVWIIYLATGTAAVAWIAVGLLLPVTGLGISMVTLGLSGERADAVAAAGSRATQAAPVIRRMSVLAVVGHGLLAVTTLLLVTLAALGASGT
jgi:hypothetical protein